MIFEALRWLGLAWDEGPDVGGPHAPYRQSERSAHLPRARRGAGEAGRGLPLLLHARAARRAARGAEGEEARTSATTATAAGSRPRRRPGAGRRAKPHVVRLAMPREGQSVVHDLLRGEVTIDNAQVDDQVLLKSDGFPTYHLANVVDDHLMGITPRDPRRGVALVAAEARAALPRLRLEAARLLPPAAAAQRRPLEDLEAQEPGEPQLLPARGLLARRRCSTSSR